MGFFQKFKKSTKEETPSTKAPLAEVVDEAHQIVEEPKKEVKKTTKKTTSKKTATKKTTQKKEAKKEVKEEVKKEVEEEKCILVGFKPEEWKKKKISPIKRNK